MHMTKQNRSVDWLTIKHFWQVSNLYKKDFLLSWGTAISALGLTIAVPYYVGKILSSLVSGHGDVRQYIYLMIAFSIVSVVSNRYTYGALFTLEPKAMAYLQTEVLQALLKRGMSFHNNRVSGKLVSDAADYPTAYIQLANSFFIDIMPFFLIVFLGIIIVLLNSLIIGLVVLVMTVLAIASAMHFRQRMAPHRKKRHAAVKAVTAHLADTIVNNQTVKSFGNEEAELTRHEKLNKTLYSARYHDWQELAKDGAYRILGLLAFQIAFILVVVHQVHQNPELLATGIFAFTYTMTLSNRLFQIGTMMRSIEEALLLAMPMTEMLQENPEIQDKPGALDLKASEGHVAFNKVSFYYTDNSKHDKVFSNLSLDIKPGEKVGLVGPSGGGKTTLTKLLLRFEDIQDGAILIDDQNIADITQVSLRRAIAYVPQEPLLFHRTIAENIAYGKTDATEEEIVAAAKLAHADKFIRELPNEYETIVGERGVKLSGGQRQRVAIARAILKDAPILVLDEATSALDSESEVAIQAALWELMQGRTTIVVAHRLSTIQRMDRIVVLDGGSIVEQGTHAELLKKTGLYAKLWGHQSGGFIEE